MINDLKLTAPVKMLRDTVVNVEQFLTLQTVYSDRATATDAFVYDAVTSVLRLECRSEPVICALNWLATTFEEKHEKCETDRAEKYVAECWLEYVPSTDVIHK